MLEHISPKLYWHSINYYHRPKNKLKALLKRNFKWKLIKNTRTMIPGYNRYLVTPLFTISYYHNAGIKSFREVRNGFWIGIICKNLICKNFRTGKPGTHLINLNFYKDSFITPEKLEKELTYGKNNF